MSSLAEELLLLALEDESGAICPAASGSLEYGLAGAVVMDLVLRGKLGMEGDRVVVADASPTGDSVLDSALERLGGSRKTRDAEDWVGRLGASGMRDPLLEQLVGRGTLEEKEEKVLWVFSRSRYPERDGGPERETRKKVRAAVLGGEPAEPRAAALIGLVKACDLVDEVFSPDERPRARERLATLDDGELIGAAVSGAVAQAEAAAQAAVAASVTAATASAAASSCSSASAGSC